MSIPRTLMATLVGTTAMTLFSHWLSQREKETYVEPELIADVVQQNTKGISQPEARLAGWNAHYGVGFGFARLYSLIWENTSVRPTLASGAILGALSGIAGIAGWGFVFKKTRGKAPVKDKRKYYEQLFVAHVIFGIGTAVGYRLWAGSKHKTKS